MSGQPTRRCWRGSPRPSPPQGTPLCPSASWSPLRTRTPLGWGRLTSVLSSDAVTSVRTVFPNTAMVFRAGVRIPHVPWARSSAQDLLDAGMTRDRPSVSAVLQHCPACAGLLPSPPPPSATQCGLSWPGGLWGNTPHRWAQPPTAPWLRQPPRRWTMGRSSQELREARDMEETNPRDAASQAGR